MTTQILPDVTPERVVKATPADMGETEFLDHLFIGCTMLGATITLGPWTLDRCHAEATRWSRFVIYRLEFVKNHNNR